MRVSGRESFVQLVSDLRGNKKPEGEAMRYATLNGGKRLRAALVYMGCEALELDLELGDSTSLAIELVHAYSLVHDDLPAMDDDDMRRGKPTNHKVFGEPIAVLAGDALLTLAFEIIGSAKSNKRYSTGDMVKELAVTSGSRHLVGGQVLDLEGENQEISPRTLQFIHESKTAALLTSSLKLGAMASGATNKKVESLEEFGQCTGLAFQVIDDILDVTQSSETLGKSAGKDEAVNKATYPAIHGLKKSKKLWS